MSISKVCSCVTCVSSLQGDDRVSAPFYVCWMGELVGLEIPERIKFHFEIKLMATLCFYVFFLLLTGVICLFFFYPGPGQKVIWVGLTRTGYVKPYTGCKYKYYVNGERKRETGRLIRLFAGHVNVFEVNPIKNGFLCFVSTAGLLHNVINHKMLYLPEGICNVFWACVKYLDVVWDWVMLCYII